ncbi:MAG: MFS transporter [Solirubrobacteraceae bacterium]
MNAPSGWMRAWRRRTRPWEHRAKRRIIETVGGHARARVIALLALVLALSSADNAAVGADAGPLKDALHLNFTQLGLLVALPALAGAVVTVPVGALTDRMRRVSLLKASILAWSLAMVAAGASDSFQTLLVSRLALGAVIGTVGPTLASLIGDFFAPSERARIYGFILTGDLIGSVAGLFVSGNAAAISWRLAFWVLAIPSALLAWAIGRYLPEPARGGAGRLARSMPSAPKPRRFQIPEAGAPDPGGSGAPSELKRALEQAGVRPRAENVLSPDRHRMKLWDAVRYVLSVPTNVALIVASSLGYFFIAGILTFGVVFVRHQYSVGQSAATSLLAVLSIAAVFGVLASGRLADALLRRGRVSSRVVVAAGSFLVAGALFLPPLLSSSLEIGLPLLWLAGAALYGSNPPLDAARLDIMPHWLWGRAEGVRTLLRSVSTAIAPLLFGLISDLLGAGGPSTHASGQAANVGGVSYAFMIMLIPLVVGGVILLRARHDYPRDVATAIASEAAWTARDQSTAVS